MQDSLRLQLHPSGQKFLIVLPTTDRNIPHPEIKAAENLISGTRELAAKRCLTCTNRICKQEVKGSSYIPIGSQNSMSVIHKTICRMDNGQTRSINHSSTFRLWAFQRHKGPRSELLQQSLERRCSGWGGLGTSCPLSKSAQPQLPRLCLQPVVWSNTGASSSPSLLFLLWFPWNHILNQLPLIFLLKLCFKGSPIKDRF